MFKRLLFRLFLTYVAISPIRRGKDFLARIIGKLGFARYTIEGSVFELNPCGIIDRLLLQGKPYDAEVLQAITTNLEQGGTFLDIGANFGLFTMIAARMPKTMVLAFEPSDRERKRLLRNVCLNDLNNVVAFPFALGSVETQATLRLGNELNTGLNTLVSVTMAGRCSGEATVFCKRIDTLIASASLAHVRVVKIDVEGFEMEVMKGFGKTLGMMQKATFVLEVTPHALKAAGSTVQALYDLFESFGFHPMFGIQSVPMWNEIFSATAKGQNAIKLHPK